MHGSMAHTCILLWTLPTLSESASNKTVLSSVALACSSVLSAVFLQICCKQSKQMHATSSCMDPWKVHVCSRLTLHSLSWFSLDSWRLILSLTSIRFTFLPCNSKFLSQIFQTTTTTRAMMMRLVTAAAAQDSPIHCAAATAACASSNNVFLERSVFSLTSSRSWDLETAGRRQLTDNASSPLKRWISCLFCKVFSSSFSRAHSLPVYLLVVFLQIVVSECFLAHCLLPVAADMLYLLLVDWKFWSSTIVVVLSPLLFALPVHIFKAFSELNNTTKDQFCVFVAKFSWWWCTLSVCWIGCKEMMRNSQRLPSPLLLWSLLVVKYKPNWQQPISSGHFLFHKICADFVLPRICCFVLA